MENINFYEVINRYGLKNPEKPLITIEDDILTYGEFLKNTKIISSAMRALGVEKNCKVGLILSNSTKWYELFWAAVRIGAQPVPIDPQSGVLEAERLLNYGDISICFLNTIYRNNNIYEVIKGIIDKVPKVSKFILVDGNGVNLPSKFINYKEFLNKQSETELEDYSVEDGHVLNLACTSGSTGNPKILSVPYDGFYKAIKDMSEHLQFNSSDCMMVGMPLYHQGGFGMGLQMIMAGGSVIYQCQFDPEKFLDTVQNKRVSVIQLTSTLAKILISNPKIKEYNLSSLRICYFAGEVLPREIAEFFVEELKVRVINVIGSSETATMTVWDSDIDYDVDPNDFNELPFTKVNVIGEDGKESSIGELCIYTSAVIYNYYNNEEATKSSVVMKDGHRSFMTGDLVQRLEDGRIRFLGRKKRIIKRGANLVHAEEVECYLLTHERIQAAAVVAEEHQIIGQMIKAYVQTVDNKPITRKEIASYFRGKLSAYKIPDKIILTEELPHDIGKIQFKYIDK